MSAAMRIVPEWREYDGEVRALQARVRRGLYQHTDTDQERHLHDAGNTTFIQTNRSKLNRDLIDNI